MPLPDKVIIPLKQGFSAETQCLVKKGDRVRCGQIIGRDDHTYSSPVHSTINGTVEHFETFTEGHEPHYGVVIRRDHADERGYAPIPNAGSPDKTKEEISEILYLAGVTSLGTTGIPSFHHTSDLDIKDVRTIVINGLTAEPFSLPEEIILEGRSDHFKIGVDLLLTLLEPSKGVHIVLDKKAGQQIGELSQSRGRDIRIHAVEKRYPLDMDELATEIATGRRVPDGGTPSELGVVHLRIQDVLHIYEAVCLGKPLIERTLSLGGPGLNESSLIRTVVGTPIEWLLLGNLHDGEERILVGGGMRGVPVESAAHPVERNFSSLTVLDENREREFLYFLKPGFSALSFSRAYLSSFLASITRRAETNIQGERRACIYCSYCEDICPRKLVPHYYSKLVKHGTAEKALKFGLEACIECGLCTFTCPSKIPLLDDIVEGKKSLEEHGRWSHPIGFQKLKVEGKI